MKISSILFLYVLLCLNISLSAQIIPKEYASLNFRLVGFSVPFGADAKNYRFEIAQGNFTSEKKFRKHIIIKERAEINRKVIEVPYFGKEYTWRVKYYNAKNKLIVKTVLYHFSTAYAPYIDTAKYRLRIIDAAKAHNDMLVLFDYSPIMYDMKGMPVWFIPDIPGVVERGRSMRDLKPTAYGTFTLLGDLGAYEFDYYGNVIWKAPDDGKVSGDTTERYHHEFTRIANKHYMVAGSQETVIKFPDSSMAVKAIETDKAIEKRGDGYYKRTRTENIIEYDSTGKVVWYWKTVDHFNNSEYFNNRFPDGSYNATPHMNAFYFDEKNNYIYISFRNMNRIVKINYPEGKIVASYGKQFNPERAGIKKMPFRAQHSCRVTDDGRLYLFNNNTDRDNNVSSYVDIFRQPESGDQQLTKLWEFPCNIDSNAAACATSGGSVYMLSDESILVGMGIAGRAFIVNPEKNVLWNALPEFKDDQNKWVPQPQYRVSNIEHISDLDKFIFR